MSKKRKLQIDVKGPAAINEAIIEMYLCVNGHDFRVYTSRENYQALIAEGFFVRDGKETDSANCINTTNVYVEQ
jgi:hypothetical protein